MRKLISILLLLTLTHNCFSQKVSKDTTIKNDTSVVIQLTPAQANSLLQLYYQLGIILKNKT